MNTKPGNSTRFQAIVSSLIFFGTIGLIVVLIYFKPKNPKREDIRKAQLVELVPVREFNKPVKVNLTGVAVPFREITMAAEVSGAIEKKEERCTAGRFVKKGEKLLSIDDDTYDFARQRLGQEVQEATTRYNKLDAEYKAAIQLTELAKIDRDTEKEEFENREKLKKMGAISDSEFNQSKKRLNAAENAYQTQKSRQDSLKSDRDAQSNLKETKRIQLLEAESDYKKAFIKAPSDGVVISDDVEEGDFVQIGQKLLVFEDTSHAEVKCDLRTDQLQKVLKASKTPVDQFSLPKLPAVIKYEAGEQTYTWNGVLDGYDGLGLDEKTRTAPCRIVVKDDNTHSLQGNRKLVRGMYVSVELDLGRRDGLVVIPADVVRADNMVWVYKPESEAGQQKAKEKGLIAKEVEEDQEGNKYREELGILKKQRIRVVSRLEGEQGELVVAELAEDFADGSLIVKTPIPQLVRAMELRRRIYLDQKPEDQPKESQTQTERKLEGDLTSPVEDSKQDVSAVSIQTNSTSGELVR